MPKFAPTDQSVEELFSSLKSKTKQEDVMNFITILISIPFI